MSLKLLRTTFNEFLEDDCPQLAAALSYYAIFSLPPLLVVVVSVAGLFVKPSDIRGEIAEQLEYAVGETAAEQVNAMIEQANVPGRSIGGLSIGIGVLLFGATGVMVALQAALNKVWDVRPDPHQGGMKTFLFKRLISIVMILCLALVLIASLVLGTVLSSVGQRVNAVVPVDVSSNLPMAVHLAVTFVVTTLSFAAMYKWLPDAKIRYRDVMVGALATSVLFVLGEVLLGMYFARVSIASTYGAAGSLALILAWIYYSGMIFLLGAEFTKNWACRHGRKVIPQRGAVRVRCEVQRDDDGRGAATPLDKQRHSGDGR